MIARIFATLFGFLLLAGCAAGTPPPPDSAAGGADAPLYRIGAGDALEIFVWRNPDLTTTVTVRPDGRITVPLINDLEASGKTPTELARDIEKALSVYVQDPLVTVVVSGFVGTFDQQVRVVGAAANPAAIPYRANMTLLDVMISVGGLAESAAGNRAKLIRVVEGRQQEFSIRLDDLVKNGDISANVKVYPGDIIIIPQAFF
ncbi:MAG: sugar ABC transporter substrate-binding protein [Alphaproteobacteria bacterium]|nr:MAG: sugar ABC transporter substrate-binding protein [Alphaproteobacteria bacterium]